MLRGSKWKKIPSFQHCDATEAYTRAECLKLIASHHIGDCRTSQEVFKFSSWNGGKFLRFVRSKQLAQDLSLKQQPHFDLKNTNKGNLNGCSTSWNGRPTAQENIPAYLLAGTGSSGKFSFLEVFPGDPWIEYSRPVHELKRPDDIHRIRVVCGPISLRLDQIFRKLSANPWPGIVQPPDVE